ncbi:MAG: HAD-IIB family hydrolase [Planctomycetaceae bacterium]|nr:HAD-IIB family hydrolase [Planctomycetales bacterium]MCB9925765.1 HAD-IIB family hydrolase [Planctomycetaceae bacterium]
MRILATDLDGTLIPLDGSASNFADLVTLAEQLSANNIRIVFVTGRHFSSVQSAIDEHRLPAPDWIICDVGTTILQQQSGHDFIKSDSYSDHLATITLGMTVADLHSRLKVVDQLRVQEAEKQGPFKLSYYAKAEQLGELCAEIEQLLVEWAAPYSLIHSVDPFNGDGLVDFLPRGVSKAYALNWWSREANLAHHEIVYAGDSGNDLAAFVAGYKTIVVGNADRSLCKRVREFHQNEDWSDRLVLANATATSGVLEGCRKFGLLDP